MNSAKDQEVKPDTSSVQDLKISFVEAAILDRLKSKGPVLTQEEKAELEKEYERYTHAHEFYFTLSLQAVAFFYAIVGGILSIYFGGSGKVNRDVIRILLGVPILMSVILGVAFVYGGFLWRDVTKYIHGIAGMLKIIRVTNVELLTYLLWGFGLLFLGVGGALFWLMRGLGLASY
jgi:hypothetical protein